MDIRSTRSRSRQELQRSQVIPAEEVTSKSMTSLKAQPESVTELPDSLSRMATGLNVDALQLLQLKQKKLRKQFPQIQGMSYAQTAAATLVFAQKDAGTAFCITPRGLLLTCAHCVAEKPSEFPRQKDKWLLFASGQAVRTKCVAWDPKRDLALLQITAAQKPPVSSTDISIFPSIPIAASDPRENLTLYCIGHPGSEDLEASSAGIATGYDVLHISSGRFRGLAEKQDPNDNSEIGALMHDCWTYWGHSGAPLVGTKGLELVGVHSSWDEETWMRRGVPLVAIRAFLDEHMLALV